jgi:malonyl-CoA/methylmalonyl-CoA synthetase
MVTNAATTLPEIFAAGRPADGSRPLLIEPDGATVTYDDAADAARRFAAAFAANGVRRGDRIALLAEKSPQALFVYLACAESGAVLVPMNPAYTDDEVGYILADADPTLVVCDQSRVGVAGARTVLTLDRDGHGTLAAAASQAPPLAAAAPPAPDDLAAVLYTSGTTGRPKGAMLTHDNLASNALALRLAWGFSDDDVLVHALPIFHTHGLFVATNTVLCSGASMRFLRRFDPKSVLDALGEATVMMGVPTFYTRLLADEGLAASACKNVRLFISGSAPLLASTHEAFSARTGQEILERYGMTELSMITSNPLHGARQPGSVGRPLDRVEVRIGAADEHGIGDVEVRGPNVFPGYWRRPDLQSSEFTTDGFFRTGDLGRVDEEGYLWLAGRSKDLVISGGLNVYPGELESVLDALPGVLESAVIGVADEDFGEAVVAIVVPNGELLITEESIRTAARTRLAGFKVPKRVHLVDELPRNAMGKVEKTSLRNRFGPS